MGKLVSVLFFVSGATGLLYEVVWAKYLVLVLGNTAHAHTVVLATFLGGLALGNALLGPYADRVSAQLRVYGVLEVGIGLLALVSPTLFLHLSDLYVDLARQGSLSPLASGGLRILLSAALLLPPTVLMGGTLPTLSRFATRSLEQLEGAVSWLYFLNSAGAVLGTLLAGFYFIPTYGLNLSLMLTGAVNIAIGLVCLLLRVKQGSVGSQGPSRVEAGPVSTVQVRIIYLTIFLSGCVSLVYEIAWIRLLSLVLGSSTYSFSLMLAAFIAGIALGSWLIAGRILPRVSSYLLFGLAELGIGVSIVLTLPVYERLPYLFTNLGGLLNRTPATFYLFEGLKFFFCFALMLLPTTFVGMMLPLASRVATQSAKEVGKKVGRVFSVNTAGNVLGAVAAGLFLLPLLGIQTLIEAGILANLLVGSLVLWSASQGSRKTKAAAVLGAFLVFFAYRAGRAPWDGRLLSSGEFRAREATEYSSYEEYKKAFAGETLLYYRDDSNMTVTVTGDVARGELYLKVNGKVDATAEGDLTTQILLSQVPLFLKPDAKKVLVVGLGSGITAGSALRHPIERLDLVEISGAVVEAERFFRPHNHNALQDPRLSLHIEDAKTVLKLAPRRYDIIISEPSNPWIAGVGNLFSVEFYNEVLAHLEDDGLMVQWFHLYEMSDDELKLVLRTFASVFKNVTMWDIQNDLLLTGSNSAVNEDFTRMETAFEQKEVRDELGRIGVGTMATLLSLHMASDRTVRRMAGEGPLNSDLFPRLEYKAPKAFYLDVESELPQRHDERWHPRKEGAVLLPRYLKSRGRPLSASELKDMAQFHTNNESNIAKGIIVEWARRFPADREALWALARTERAEDKLESARVTMTKLLEIAPGQPEYIEAAADIELQLYWEDQTYLTSVRPEKALAYYMRLLELGTDRRVQIRLKLARLYELVHDYRRSLDSLESAASDSIRDAKEGAETDAIWLAAAKIARKMGDIGLAVGYARSALKHNPENSGARVLLEELSGADR
jgi:predicted membrane-bound spermidine synthase/tetratricopeptide (TPR) repeat protein